MFSFLLDNENNPEKSMIENALEACTYVCWKYTDLIKSDKGSNELIDYCTNTVSMFKEILPKLIDWSVLLEEILLAESFLIVSV